MIWEKLRAFLGALRIALRAAAGRGWWWVTLLVIVGMLVLARLGIWQLDRLEQRRALNAQLWAQLNAPPLDLNEAEEQAKLDELVDRQAVVAGQYDLEQQVLLKLQSFNGRAGGHLLTPLLLRGNDRAVLVDRGWIPEAELAPHQWGQFDEVGQVVVSGYLQAPQRRPERAVASTTGPQQEWYRVDLEAIEAQLPYDLLPVYLLAAPPPEGNSTPPFRQEPQFDLSEGSHLSYAIQWFTFALMLSVGYLYFVYRSTLEEQRKGQHGEQTNMKAR